jgi:hypothetical protein
MNQRARTAPAESVRSFWSRCYGGKPVPTFPHIALSARTAPAESVRSFWSRCYGGKPVPTFPHIALSARTAPAESVRSFWSRCCRGKPVPTFPHIAVRKRHSPHTTTPSHRAARRCDAMSQRRVPRLSTAARPTPRCAAHSRATSDGSARAGADACCAVPPCSAVRDAPAL